MGSRTFWAAMQGLGQGVQHYGGLLSRDAMATLADERTFDRQKELQRISQQFRRDLRDEERAYALEGITPGTDLFTTQENYRQKLRGEKLADEKSLLEARADAYGYGSRGRDPISSINLSSFTTESAAAFMQEYKRLRDAGKSVADARDEAYVKHPLELKPSSTSGQNQATTRSVNEALGLMMDEVRTAGTEPLIEFLEQAGYPRANLTQMSQMELFALYKRVMEQMFAPGPAQPGGGLMDSGLDGFGQGGADIEMPNLDPLGWMDG